GLWPDRAYGPRILVSAALRQLLWFLLAGTRGGLNRARIIEALRARPRNANQLGNDLGLDYRTIRHHLHLLERNGLLKRPAGPAYAAPYLLAIGAFEALGLAAMLWSASR